MVTCIINYSHQCCFNQIKFCLTVHANNRSDAHKHGMKAKQKINGNHTVYERNNTCENMEVQPF